MPLALTKSVLFPNFPIFGSGFTIHLITQAENLEIILFSRFPHSLPTNLSGCRVSFTFRIYFKVLLHLHCFFFFNQYKVKHIQIYLHKAQEIWVLFPFCVILFWGLALLCRWHRSLKLDCPTSRAIFCHKGTQDLGI